MKSELFPTDLKDRKWLEFPAEGFSGPACGVIYRAGQAACGLPLGGIATGHIDLDTDGTLGRCTIFDSVMPPRELGGAPFLGLAVEGDVWALTTKDVQGANNAKDIYYWGHYPIADLKYDIESPISVDLRAWSPFLPGDAEGSNTPAAVFEVRLTNKDSSDRNGAIVFTFPGPDENEAPPESINRDQLEESGLSGIHVRTGEDSGYALGAIGESAVRVGGDLNATDGAWAVAAKTLPPSVGGGASVAVDFNLKPGESLVKRFLLTWYRRAVKVNGRHMYLHAYGTRFADAAGVARLITQEHESLLKRIIAWQEVIYGEVSLPIWLRDCLVNSMHLMAEDAFWESNSVPPEDWARDTGIFCMVESTRTCPGQSCMPSDWLGNLPVVYFFPRLALSTLRGFAHLQLPNGEIPIYWGQYFERQNPVYQLLVTWTSCNYVDLVDRLWQRTDDAGVLYEFYPSVKRAVEFMRSLDSDADGLVDCCPGAMSQQGFGDWFWYGAATQVAGFWLSTLRMAERMADAVRDQSFAKDCQVWFKLGSQSLESKLWNGSYYLLYNEVESNRKDDTILANQLDGEWNCMFHGLESAFPPDRVKTALATIASICGSSARWGAANAMRPDGSLNCDAGYQSSGIFVAENLILAATMIYNGHRDTGLCVAYENMENIVLEKGLAWDMPGVVNADTGEVERGHDFDQLMAIWALPAALFNETLAESAAPGRLVDRIIKAVGCERR